MTGFFLRAGPYAVLAAVAAWLRLAWESLPRHYPVHWGPGGADRWVDLSVRSVGTPLLMGALAITWIGALRRMVLRGSSPVPDAARSRLLVANVTVASQWFLALLFGLAAVPSQGPGLVLGGAAVGFLVVPAALVATYVGAPPPVPTDPPAPPPGGWLFVPRPNGSGLDVVRRHPGFWRAAALLAAGPALLILVAILA